MNRCISSINYTSLSSTDSALLFPSCPVTVDLHVSDFSFSGTDNGEIRFVLGKVEFTPSMGSLKGIGLHSFEGFSTFFESVDFAHVKSIISLVGRSEDGVALVSFAQHKDLYELHDSPFKR